jgi:hypothetical protein
VESLEAQINSLKEQYVAWCGFPGHEPDMSHIPEGTTIIQITTGVCGSDCPNAPFLCRIEPAPQEQP